MRPAPGNFIAAKPRYTQKNRAMPQQTHTGARPERKRSFCRPMPRAIRAIPPTREVQIAIRRKCRTIGGSLVERSTGRPSRTSTIGGDGDVQPESDHQQQVPVANTKPTT